MWFCRNWNDSSCSGHLPKSFLCFQLVLLLFPLCLHFCPMVALDTCMAKWNLDKAKIETMFGSGHPSDWIGGISEIGRELLVFALCVLASRPIEEPFYMLYWKRSLPHSPVFVDIGLVRILLIISVWWWPLVGLIWIPPSPLTITSWHNHSQGTSYQTPLFKCVGLCIAITR